MGKKRYFRKKKQNQAKKNARQLIATLLERMKKVYGTDAPLADRYVLLARKAAMKVRIRLFPDQKRLFCKKCYRHLIPGKTSRVRINRSKIVTLCLHCKHISRFPLTKR